MNTNGQDNHMEQPKAPNRPRIAHVNFCPSMGVYKKIAGQAQASKEAHLDIDFFILTDKPLHSDCNLNLIRFDWPKNLFKRKIAKNFKRYQLLTELTDLSGYDRIILRYPTSVDLRFQGFLEKYGGRFISEHHADVIGELKVLEKGVLNPLRIRLERKNASKILAQSSGIIGVTEEIRNIYVEVAGKEKPSAVIPNGIDVESVPFSEYLPYDQGQLNLLFVSSTFYPSHGLDRLLRGLQDYKGHYPISLTLVGDIYRREERTLLRSLNDQKVKVTRHKQLSRDELNRVFSQTHLAVSTLALFRGGLKQGCPLKTREYMARGLPFIYSYDDLDLNEDLKFYLKIPANNDAVNIDDLFHFAVSLSDSNTSPRQMRQYAENTLDWTIKMREMHTFALSTL